MLDVVQKAFFKTSLSSYCELFFLKSCKCLKHKAISKAVFSKLALRIDTKLKPLSRGYMIVGTGCQKEYEKMSLQVLLWKWNAFLLAIVCKICLLCKLRHILCLDITCIIFILMYLHYWLSSPGRALVEVSSWYWWLKWQSSTATVAIKRKKNRFNLVKRPVARMHSHISSILSACCYRSNFRIFPERFKFVSFKSEFWDS